MERVIIHSDINSCYASIECSLNPEYKGKPLAVGGSVENRHGIILAKTPEAKNYGVTTGEPLWQAKLKCPDLIIVPPHFDMYMKYSSLAHDIYARYTDRIEKMGLDEAWCDITGSILAFGGKDKIIDEIRKAFKTELGITVSIGVSFNKFFAKLGSDLACVDSVYEIGRNDVEKKVWPLPVNSIMGIGRNATKKLSGYGINTIGELASCSCEWLRLIFGVIGEEMWKIANGLDTSVVEKDDFESPIKSVGHGITCTADLVDANEVWKVFLSLSQSVSKRLKESSLEAKSVQIGVRDSHLSTVQFQCELPIATQSATEIAKAATELFCKNYNWNYDVRAVTVRAINLRQEGTPFQLDMANDYAKHKKQRALDDTIMELRRRFGEDSIFNCCLMTERKMPYDTKGEFVAFKG